MIGRHDGQIACAVLAVVSPAHLDTRNLGHCVGTIGGLQRAAQQIGFSDGLRAVSGIDAARAQEQETLHAGKVGAVNDICLDGKIGVDEIRRIRVIGVNAANLGCGQKDMFRALMVEKRAGSALLHEIEAFQPDAAGCLGAEIR